MFPRDSTLMQLQVTKVTMEFLQKLMNEAVEYVFVVYIFLINNIKCWLSIYVNS